jgi:hypothetical protein
MHNNGTIKSSKHIKSLLNGGPLSFQGDQFGYSISGLGDLDGDSIVDIAVGAPGYIVASVFILFMNSDGSVKSYKLIRGPVQGSLTSNGTSFAPNGPPLRFGSRFGTAVAGTGDLDRDGCPDLAVSALEISTGNGQVYVLFLDRSGSVRNFSMFDNFGVGGGPVVSQSFPGFGSSLALLSVDGQETIIGVGSKDYFDPASAHTKSGAVFICRLNTHGTVKSFTLISETSSKSLGSEYVLPSEVIFYFLRFIMIVFYFSYFVI